MRRHLKIVQRFFPALVIMLIMCSLPTDPLKNPENANITIEVDSVATNSGDFYTDTIGSTVSISLVKRLPQFISSCTLSWDIDTVLVFSSDSFPDEIKTAHVFNSPGKKTVIASITRKNATVYRDTVFFDITGFSIEITQQPSNITDSIGKYAELSVTVTGSQPITFQWYKNDNPLKNKTASKLAFDSLKMTSIGNYHCNITNPLGSVICSTVTVRVSNTPQAPTITGKNLVNVRRPVWLWGSVDGGNGTFRYQLDGGDFVDNIITTKDTTFFSTVDLSDGPHTLYLQAQNDAGNWSQTSRYTIIIDTEKPVAPEVTGSASLTNNPMPTWYWTGDQDTIVYRFKLNSAILSSDAVETTATEFTPSANLINAIHTLYVQARDEAGNWSDAGSFAITVDITAPVAPTVNGDSRTTSITPRWSWISNGGGKGLFRCNLNSDSLDQTSFMTNALTYLAQTELAEGSYTLYVQEQDSSGNWSPSGSFTTLIDTTAPEAPVVIGTTPTNNLKPVWHWSTPAQSSGTFRYKIDSEDLSSGAVTTNDTSYAPAIELTTGSHALYVQTRDETGNWSKSSVFVISIDTIRPAAPAVTGEVITNSKKPSWHWNIPFDGINSRYKINSEDFTSGATLTVDTFFTSSDDLSEGRHTLYVQVQDAAGNWSTNGSVETEIDITPPGEPTVFGPMVTNSQTPGWSWISAGDGRGTYRLLLGNSTISEDTASNTFTVATSLNEGTYKFSVQERDEAGNWSTAGSSTTQIDLSAAGAPAVTGISPTNSLKPTWSWKNGGGNSTYRYKLDNADLNQGATTISDSSFTPTVDLSEGNHILYVQESDGIGNWSSPGLFAIIIDITAPPAPVVTGITPTNIATPTWNWTSAEDGAGIFRYNFNNNFADFFTTTLKSYTAPSALAENTHTLYIQEKDEAGNWSHSRSFPIRIDLTIPLQPVVTALTPTNNQKPAWNWTSTAIDGCGTYRYKLDSDDMTTGTTILNANSYTPDNNLTEGTHTLYVQESDTAGNWSLTSNKTVIIDITGSSGPIFSTAIVTPTNDRTPTWSWTSGTGGINRYKYKIDMGSWTDEVSATSFTFSSDQNEGSYTLYIQEKDYAGNWSLIQSKIIYIDYTKPAAPVFTSSTTASPTTLLRPRWFWASGDNTGAKIFKYKLDNGLWSSETAVMSYSPPADLSEGYHNLSVKERDAALNWSDSTVRSIGILPPSPSNPKALTSNSSAINVTWTDNAKGEYYYYVYYGTSSTSFSSYRLVSANSTSVMITGLTAATSYYFRIHASGPAGNSPYSSIVNGHTTVATPTILAQTLPLTSTVIVTLSCSTPSVKIYYTIDGSTPSSLSSQYTASFPTKKGITLRVIAIHSVFPQSALITQLL